MSISLFNSGIIVIAVCCFGNLSRADVAVSNLSNHSGGSLLGPKTTAESFTTGAMPAIFNSVTVEMVNTSDMVFGLYNTYGGGIYSDAGGVPGSLLDAFPDQVFPNQGSEFYTFNPVTGLALAPNTTYWFVMVRTGSAFAYWLSTEDVSDTSSYEWTLGDDTLNLSSSPTQWVGHISGHPEIGYLSIDATILPEPSLLAVPLLSLAVLGNRARRRA